MTLRRLLINLFLLGLAVGVAAHPRHEISSQLRYNTRSQSLEITHQFKVHEAEVMLLNLRKPADLLVDPQALEGFAEYIHTRFELRSELSILPLELVGAERDGDDVWVYQDVPLKVFPTKLFVRNRLLDGAPDGSLSLVNLEFGLDIYTQLIRSDRVSDRWQLIYIKE